MPTADPAHVVCYPQPGKARSREVLEAFAAGARAAGARADLCTTPPDRPGPGGAAFYGCVGLERLLAQARASSNDWWYGDNAFFDRSRGRYFRFAHNAFQSDHGSRLTDHGVEARSRLAALGVALAPWHRGGRHVVVVEQSAHFLGLCGAGADWLDRTLGEIRRGTDRPLRVRAWRRDKDKAAATLAHDLAGAWALVTHTSAAANEALLAGVPVFVTGPCAATPLAGGPLSALEQPRYPDHREDWAAGLAASQWTLDELRAGMAWRALQDG